LDNRNLSIKEIAILKKKAVEMGIQSTDNRGRSYGLRGHTPVIKKSGSRFKCNMLAAISPQGFMNWMVFN